MLPAAQTLTRLEVERLGEEESCVAIWSRLQSIPKDLLFFVILQKETQENLLLACPIQSYHLCSPLRTWARGISCYTQLQRPTAEKSADEQ